MNYLLHNIAIVFLYFIIAMHSGYLAITRIHEHDARRYNETGNQTLIYIGKYAVQWRVYKSFCYQNSRYLQICIYMRREPLSNYRNTNANTNRNVIGI